MSVRDEAEVGRASRALALQTAAVLLVVLGLLGVFIYSLVASSQRTAAQLSVEEASELESPDDAPAGVFVAIFDGDQWLLPSRIEEGVLPDLDAAARVEEGDDDDEVITTSVSSGDHDFTVTTVREDGRIVQVAVDAHENREELDRLLTALLAAGALAILAVTLAAWWLARRTLRPMAEALALQRRFVADASHELRTPLTLLSTRAQLLRRSVQGGADADALPDRVDRLVDDARALTEVLDDLLIAADPREGGAPERVDLAACADGVIESMLPTAEARGIRLHRDGDAGPLPVNGSRAALARLCTALVSNALDYALSTIRIDVRAEGGDIVMRFSDDGPGFPPGTDERVFERFAGTRGATADASRHYGLGLSLVAEIAARYGGTVTIDTEAAPGAHIVVRLPRARAR